MRAELKDGYYGYLNENDPYTWNLYNNGEQDYDSFGEAILMIILELEKDVFPA